MTQFEAIQTFVASKGEPMMGLSKWSAKAGVWIGFNDKASEAGTNGSKFAWSDNSSAWAGAPWAAGAPVADSGGTANDCVQMLYESCTTIATISSASCSASSLYSASFPCTHAFDTSTTTQWATKGEAAGSWIETKFPEMYVVTKFEFMQRPAAVDKTKGVTLSFSDGTSKAFTLQNNNNLQSFAVVPPVYATSVRLTVTSIYTTQGHNGAKMIRFSGCVGSNLPRGNFSNTLCASKRAYLCYGGGAHAPPRTAEGKMTIADIFDGDADGTDRLIADGSVKPEVTAEIAAALQSIFGGGDVEITKNVATRTKQKSGDMPADKYSLNVEYRAAYRTAAGAQRAIKATEKCVNNACSSLTSALKSGAGGFFAKQEPKVKMHRAIDPVVEAQQCGAPPAGKLLRKGKSASTVCGRFCHGCFVSKCESLCNAEYKTDRFDCSGSAHTGGNACWCTGHWVHWNSNVGRWKAGGPKHGRWGGCNYWATDAAWPTGGVQSTRTLAECKAQCGPGGLNDQSKVATSYGTRVGKDETCRMGCEFGFDGLMSEGQVFSYRHNATDKKTWEEANNACVQDGLHLAWWQAHTHTCRHTHMHTQTHTLILMHGLPTCAGRQHRSPICAMTACMRVRAIFVCTASSSKSV